jgi:dTDP-4-amino-4,6-dideoxygalactose transaminase
MRIPLAKPDLPSLEQIAPQLDGMLQSGRISNFGPYSKALEEQISAFSKVKNALCVSNATTGLTLLLNTLAPGSEVIVPSFTFAATTQALLWNSLVPVFADIDSHSYTLSVESVAATITDKTSAIVAVHTFGNPCKIEGLKSIAERCGLRLFYDSAHALGSRHHGAPLGQFGDAEVFSLSATKLVACGEGGAITTNDEDLLEAVIDRRNYGLDKESCDCVSVGANGKITEFSSILGLWSLSSLNERVQRRNRIAQSYINGLRGLPGLQFQKIQDEDTSSFKDFTVRIDADQFGLGRDRVRQLLAEAGIETRAYFSPSLHRTSLFATSATEYMHLETTDLVARSILSLPIYGEFRDRDQDYVIETLCRIHENAKRL